MAAVAQLRNGVTVLLTISPSRHRAYTSIRFDANAARLDDTAGVRVVRGTARGDRRVDRDARVPAAAALKAQYVKELRLDGVTDYRATDIEYLVASSQNFGGYVTTAGSSRTNAPTTKRSSRRRRRSSRFSPSSDHPRPRSAS
jgi:hypothetical protein